LLDHTKVKAPYIRVAKAVLVPDSNYQVTTFDLRLRTPNTEIITPPVIHSLEHLLAVSLRSVCEENHKDLKVIDVSPMGCRTGFYLTFLSLGDYISLKKIKNVVTEVFDFASQIQELPGAKLETCGAYKEHDLLNAKAEISNLQHKELEILISPPRLS
jgi:S-ribosylhomocysteine lyase